MIKKLIFCLLLFILLNSVLFAYYTVDYVAIDNLIVDTDFSNVIKKLEQVKTEDLSKVDKEIVNRKLSDYYKYNNEYDKSKAALKDAMSYSDKNNLKNLDEYSVEIIENEIVPKLSTSNSKIYVFETGWIRVKPGNNDETEQNGFLISESNEQKFKIIHNWGE